MAASGVDSELLSEVIAVCNDLGHKTRGGDNKYILNKKESNGVIKDLIRFLRNDDKHRFPVRKQLGVTNIVANDLIPIVEQHSLQDISLFDRVLRLLVDLTNPSILLFQQRVPTEKMEKQIYLELQSILYSYKQCFGSHKRFWTVLAKHLSRIVKLDDEHRQVEDTLIFERILVLIRNILHIPIDTNLDRTAADDDTNPHDRIIEMMSISGINELIVFLSSDQSHQEFCFHLIEMISLMFREQNAEFIAKSVGNEFGNDNQRCDFERDIDRKELQELKARDLSLRNKVPMNLNRFNGTYSVKNLKSISNRDIIFHKNPDNFDRIDFDANKCNKRKNKRQQPMTDCIAQKSAIGAPVVHRSAPKIRKILFDFCTDFLNNYNQFMSQIRDNLNRNMSQVNDETYYLWAIQFFMEFLRCNPKMNDNSLVSEIMSAETFHFLQTQIDHYMEYIVAQKDDISLWSKRLHYGLKAYRELLFSLNDFENGRDEGLRMRAKKIKSGIFYEEEYRDLLHSLLIGYKETKMSKTFLKDLIETNHIFLKMLENYYKTNSRLLVRRKARKAPKKRSQKKKQNKTPPEEVWIEIMSTVSEALQGSIDLPKPEDDFTVRALDPASEKPIDEQKMEVLKRVHKFLMKKSVAEAVALYRDARNCWSGDDDNAFGAPDIPLDEELLSLNEVLMTDFPDNEIPDEEEEEEVDEELVDAQSSSRERKEVEVELSEVINKYCSPTIVCNYALLLKQYDTNSEQTNHCLVKMLHRIAFDSKMHAILFQVSIFRTFQRILSDPLRNQSPSVKELAHFAKFIIGKFVIAAQQSKKVFVDILFWKRSGEAIELDEGYRGTQCDGNEKKGKTLWSDEQKLELEVLFNELKDKTEAEKDYIDLILEKMIDESKTRRQVIRQLKEQNLYFKPKSKRTNKERKKKVQKEGEDFIDDQIVEQYSDKSDESDDDSNDLERERNPMKVTDSEDQQLKESNISGNDYTSIRTTTIIPVTNDSDNEEPIKESDENRDLNKRKVSYNSEEEEEIVITKKRKRISRLEDEEDSNQLDNKIRESLQEIGKSLEQIDQNVNKEQTKGIGIDSDDSSHGNSPLLIDENLENTVKSISYDSEEEEMVSIKKKKKRRVVVMDDDD